jgi:hypothetical protein
VDFLRYLVPSREVGFGDEKVKGWIADQHAWLLRGQVRNLCNKFVCNTYLLSVARY